jgi:glycosyltransferase involved in cell wall biosynthesis
MPSGKKTSLSVLVPVYNEQYLVRTSLTRLEVLATSPALERIEVIVVDDCSKDDTPTVLREFAAEREGRGGPITWKFFRHEKNGGKGKAIQTALGHATCEISVIHDADLEYHPKDLVKLTQVFVEEEADAVFGSRFAGAEVRRAIFFRHEMGNRLLTLLCNLVTNMNLTDMETCYKAVRTDLLKSIPIVSNDFRLEPELTIKLAKRQARIYEVPISYSGRGYQEGKKINWRDGFRALSAMAGFALSDEIYRADAYRTHLLARRAKATRFNAWMADVIRPFCGDRVLEIGGGSGTFTLQLVPRRTFVVSDVNPLHLQRLRALQSDRPYLDVVGCDVEDRSTFPTTPGGFDTVIGINVIEHVKDDRQALANIRSVMSDDGRAILMVPHGPKNFGTLDEALGHQRRYSRESLTELARAGGFEVERLIPFNRFSAPVWFINGRIFKRRSYSALQIRVLNLLVPIIKLFDTIAPTSPLSLIAVLRPAKR